MSDFLLGGTYPTSIKLGNTIVSKLMMGSVQVWPRMVGGFGRLYNWFCTQPQGRKVKYGYLYNWYAATDVRNIANTGAHLPSQNEAGVLEVYLGGRDVAGGKLKETGLTHWNSPNVGATNEVGFNGVGGGMREEVGSVFRDINIMSISWNSGSMDINRGFYFQYNNDMVASYNNTSGNPNKKAGFSIRLLKDSTTLTNGQIGSYTGNDGRVYKTICIGTQEWLSENLAETKYRDGSLIPKVTDNAAWAALTTGAMCAYNNDEANVFETASIAPVGWHVPTYPETDELITYLGGALLAGGHMKEIGFNHWSSPNSGADNSSGFNGLSGGQRANGGLFTGINVSGLYITSTSPDENTVWNGFLTFNSASNYISGFYRKTGSSLRLIKNDSADPGTLTDIDGNVYPTVKIGTQVWTAANWKCTKYNDGTPIPNVTDNAAWSALTTGAQCVYNNDNANI